MTAQIIVTVWQHKPITLSQFDSQVFISDNNG